jgi:hypothetical protein
MLSQWQNCPSQGHHLPPLPHFLSRLLHIPCTTKMLEPVHNPAHYTVALHLQTHCCGNPRYQIPNLIIDMVCLIATGYGPDEWGIRVLVPIGSRILISPYCPDRLWGPLNLLSNAYWGVFPRGVKQQGREADHSPPTSAEVKKMWIYTSTLP